MYHKTKAGGEGFLLVREAPEGFLEVRTWTESWGEQDITQLSLSPTRSHPGQRQGIAAALLANEL